MQLIEINILFLALLCSAKSQHEKRLATEKNESKKECIEKKNKYVHHVKRMCSLKQKCLALLRK